MGTDSQIVLPNSKSPQILGNNQPTSIEFKQQGSGNTQIGNVEHYDSTLNQTIVVLNGPQSNNSNAVLQNLAFNYDCFNLFVVEGETFDQTSFIVPKNRALTESTPKEIRAHYSSLSPEAVKTVKTFPAIFCSENRYFTKSSPDHIAFYGYVSDIMVIDNGIKIFFHILNRFNQQILIDMAKELHIDEVKSYSELCRTHWAIKKVNVIDVFEKRGHRLFRI